MRISPRRNRVPDIIAKRLGKENTFADIFCSNRLSLGLANPPPVAVDSAKLDKTIYHRARGTRREPMQGTAWPELRLEAWKDTYATLHMWTQIVGKVRLALSPRINHWWEVPLYVNCLGLTTSPIPYEGGIFEIQFDFLHHQLTIHKNDGAGRTLALAPQSVADFYRELMAA